jgi:hypothetical protein
LRAHSALRPEAELASVRLLVDPARAAYGALAHGTHALPTSLTALRPELACVAVRLFSCNIRGIELGPRSGADNLTTAAAAVAVAAPPPHQGVSAAALAVSVSSGGGPATNDDGDDDACRDDLPRHHLDHYHHRRHDDRETGATTSGGVSSGRVETLGSHSGDASASGAGGAGSAGVAGEWRPPAPPALRELSTFSFPEVLAAQLINVMVRFPRLRDELYLQARRSSRCPTDASRHRNNRQLTRIRREGSKRRIASIIALAPHD